MSSASKNKSNSDDDSKGKGKGRTTRSKSRSKSKSKSKTKKKTIKSTKSNDTKSRTKPPYGKRKHPRKRIDDLDSHEWINPLERIIKSDDLIKETQTATKNGHYAIVAMYGSTTLGEPCYWLNVIDKKEAAGYSTILCPESETSSGIPNQPLCLYQRNKTCV